MSFNINASLGLGFRADVRTEIDVQSDLPTGSFVDLVMVGGGHNWRVRTWVVPADRAADLAENPEALIAFVAGALGAPAL